MNTTAEPGPDGRLKIWTDFRGADLGHGGKPRILLSLVRTSAEAGTAPRRVSRSFAADRPSFHGGPHHLGYLAAIARALRLGAELCATSVVVYTPCRHALAIVSGSAPVDDRSVGVYLQTKALLRCFDEAEIRVTGRLVEDTTCLPLAPSETPGALPGLVVGDSEARECYSVTRSCGGRGHRRRGTQIGSTRGRELSELWGGNGANIV